MFKQSTHPTEPSFTALPDTAYFNELCASHRPHTTSSPIPTEPNTPNSHDSNHIAGMSSAFASSCKFVPTTANAPSGRGITRQYALFLDFDEEFDGEECEMTIQKLLESLHIKYPVLNYLQFRENLQALGINYLATAAVLDANFYMRKVGMSQGAAHLFCDGVVTELRRGAGQKRAERRGLGAV